MGHSTDDSPVGVVVGSPDTTTGTFKVAVVEGRRLQSDDLVHVHRDVPGEPDGVNLYGVVTEVSARDEGASFASDGARIAAGSMPSSLVEVAQVEVTRRLPDVKVPALPGLPAQLAVGEHRGRALRFDDMGGFVPAGLLSGDGEPFYLNREFIDGTSGSHVNISGMSGVATKTTYALSLLHYALQPATFPQHGDNVKALVFNVKGEDLLFIDRPNARLTDQSRADHAALGVPAHPFPSVELWSPAKNTPHADDGASSAKTRSTVVGGYCWTLQELCSQRLLPYLFTEPDATGEIWRSIVDTSADYFAKEAKPAAGGSVTVDGRVCRTLFDLADSIAGLVGVEGGISADVSPSSAGAFMRRFRIAARECSQVVRGGLAVPEGHSVAQEAAVTVVDIHALSAVAQRFVVGALLKGVMSGAEQGDRRLRFVVLDELNKYAPKEGQSPIKSALIDIAERGRSLGVCLIGAQQTASNVDERIVSNASIKVVGRLDRAEANKAPYQHLSTSQRARASNLEKGTMIVHQPDVPVPQAVRFPFPAFATNRSESEEPASSSAALSDDDLFARTAAP